MQPGNQISLTDKIVAITGAFGEKPFEEIREQLISLVNELINTDFNALVQLLYRVDVDENKLKQLLQQHSPAESASLIADLIISRQLQKVATKKQFSDGGNTGPDDSW